VSSTLNQPGGDERGGQIHGAQPAESPTFSAHPRPKRRGLLTLLLLLALIPLLVYGWNYLTLQHKMSEVLEKDPRNKGVEVSVHYKWASR
jgi:hypothetical protein